MSPTLSTPLVHRLDAAAIADPAAWEPFGTPDGIAGETVALVPGPEGALRRASLWRHEAGPLDYRRPDSTEAIYVIAGRARITAADGATVEIAAGDAVLVPQGFDGTWLTLEPLVKFSVVVAGDVR